MVQYDLEIGKIVSEIKLVKAKLVCIQLPDGLKPKATKIADELTKKTGAKIHIWLGSNFGACDIPLQLRPLKFDLIVNFGHSKI
jgi:diphthamide biosynthesis enzyme Dph1/Dph2-like protein